MLKAHVIPILLLIASAACSDTADTTPDAEPTQQQAAVRDEAPSGRPAPRAAACGITRGTILTGDGVGRLRVGVSLADVREECTVVRDTTTLGAEGMQERRIAVDLRRDTIEAVVSNERVWRIHVDGSAFRTAEGLGVGSTVGELRQDRTARVMAGEGSMFIALADHCGLSFRLSGVPFGRERPVAELPADGRVVEVLVFGCESPQP